MATDRVILGVRDLHVARLEKANVSVKAILLPGERSASLHDAGDVLQNIHSVSTIDLSRTPVRTLIGLTGHPAIQNIRALNLSRTLLTQSEIDKLKGLWPTLKDLQLNNGLLELQLRESEV